MISILILLSLTTSVLNEPIDLEDGKAEEIYRLYKGKDYYFYIKATDNQVLKIEMYMDNMSRKPFNYISIAEYETKSGDFLRSNNYNVITSQKNWKTFISQTYSVWCSSTNYVLIAITASYDVTNFKITVSISGLSTLTIILLSTLIPFFCCVIICIILVVVLRKRRTINLTTQNQLISSAQPTYAPAQPLYASPQPVYAPIQPQYIPPTQQQYSQQVLAPGLSY